MERRGVKALPGFHTKKIDLISDEIRLFSLF